MTHKARLAAEYFILARIVGGTHSEKVLDALLFLHASRNLTLRAQKKAASATYFAFFFWILCAIRSPASAGLCVSPRIAMAPRRSRSVEGSDAPHWHSYFSDSRTRPIPVVNHPERITNVDKRTLSRLHVQRELRAMRAHLYFNNESADDHVCSGIATSPILLRRGSPAVSGALRRRRCCVI